MNSYKKATSGITLIALVITIIVLLILAGVSIVTLTGNNGILTQAGGAKTNTEIADAKERAKVDIATWISDKLQKGENSSLNDAKIKEILTGKAYVKGLKDTSFISSKGHEINYSDLYDKNLSKANKPEKRDNMEFIKYNETTKDWEVVTDENSDWYSYEETTDEDMTDGGTTNGGNSRWANGRLNGNYYVWIPRYAYKIDNSVTYTSQSGTSHKLDVKFVGTEITNNNVEEGYIVHPAFTFGDQELSGIWVGKYETTGTQETPTIKPNETSLRNINVSTMFNTVQKLSTTSYDAHMMKNTEWGAVAYLAQSQYGRNGTEVSVNQCSSYYTGVGTGTGENKIWNSTYTWENITEDQKYNGEIGKLSSTTGNVYGIYDMSGGANEFVMGVYGEEGNPTKGSSGFTIFPDKKYYDLYSNPTGSSSDYNGAILGDATKETAKWNSDDANFVYSISPFFLRGGSFGGSYIVGICYFRYSYGNANSSIGCHVCLAVK